MQDHRDSVRKTIDESGALWLRGFDVTTPAEFVGPIQSDLARRGAVVEGEDLRGELRVIRGTVALNEMFGYSTTVRSLSQGRASYSMETAGFREVPPDVAKRLSFGD